MHGGGGGAGGGAGGVPPVGSGISGTVSVHDKFQIEMKFSCPIDRAKKRNDYHIDVFFFLPHNLGINRNTFDHKQFYDNLTEYIRLKTPEVDLGRLAEPDNPELGAVAGAMQLLREHREGAVKLYTERLRMFCSIAKSAFRDGANRIAARPESGRPEAAELYLAQLKAVVNHFRRLRKEFDGIGEEAQGLFDLVDEYLSISVNLYRYRLWDILPGAAGAEIRKRIVRGARREIEYRRARNFPSTPDRDGDNTEIVYRESVLKKAMAGVLFLNVAMREDGVFLENVFLGVAAAIAMIFVTGIAFLWKGLFLEEFSLSFFVVWVVAYMFKDRIKSLLQNYFLTNKERYSYDYRQIIREASGRRVGCCREGVRFLPESRLDAALAARRGRARLSRLETGMLAEDILTFRKRIELETAPCAELYRAFKVNGVVDIVRFNVRDWLRRMDNPVRSIRYPEEDGTLKTLKAHRIYHVNMLIRYGAPGSADSLVRYRLVLDRNGLREAVAVE